MTKDTFMVRMRSLKMGSFGTNGMKIQYVNPLFNMAVCNL